MFSWHDLFSVLKFYWWAQPGIFNDQGLESEFQAISECLATGQAFDTNILHITLWQFFGVVSAVITIAYIDYSPV